jgi:DNA-directed RNA polymerase specialized sigma24 family protein
MDGRSSSPRTPDGMLAMSARGGDMQAFGELYHRHARAVYDYLLRTLHDPTVAADLTQSTFRRAFGRFGGLRDADRVRPWLFTLAYHLAVAQMRRAPVPPMVEELPRKAPLGPSQPGTVDQLDSAELVWTAASSIGPELYAVLDLTARQGVDLVDLVDSQSLTRADALALLERAHDSFGRAARAIVLDHGEEWCPGLATLLQGAETADAGGAQAIDEHLGRCPRCRPLAERLTSSSTLAGLPLFELPHQLAAEGWDQLVADLMRASPRATQGLAVDSGMFASPGATDENAPMIGYTSFHASGADLLASSEHPGMLRHEAVRKYHAQAERERMRRTVLGTMLVVLLFAGVIAGAVILSNRGPATATVTTTSVVISTTHTTRPPPPPTHPTTTRPKTTTTAKHRSTTTTLKATTTTAPPLGPPPTVSSVSPTSGYPGAAIVVYGTGFRSGDFVAYTGPTYPGQTELITPGSESPTMLTSAVPSFASFAGQQIVITVRDNTGRFQGSAVFVVEAYYSGDWTVTGAKVSLTPTTAAHGTTRDGQLNLFSTDVEGDQCMVDDTMPVYAPLGGGPPIAAIAKTKGCQAAEFAVTGH